MNTKQTIIASIREAIKTETPSLICFRNIATIAHHELSVLACHEFEANGMRFCTGFADTEYYSFVDHRDETSDLSIQDLKLLLWWLEQGDTKVVEPTQKMNNTEKTSTEKLAEFRDQMHNLLIKHPEIRLAGSYDGDAIAWIRGEDGIKEIYLPNSGQQEPIRELTANGVPVGL